MEYVIAFQDETSRLMHLGNAEQRREAMQMSLYLSRWLKAARRLYHERVITRQEDPRDDFSTTDGAIRAASGALGRMAAQIIRLGGQIDDRDQSVVHELQRRNSSETHRTAMRMRGSRPR